MLFVKLIYLQNLDNSEHIFGKEIHIQKEKTKFNGMN